MSRWKKMRMLKKKSTRVDENDWTKNKRRRRDAKDP